LIVTSAKHKNKFSAFFVAMRRIQGAGVRFVIWQGNLTAEQRSTIKKHTHALRACVPVPGKRFEDPRLSRGTADQDWRRRVKKN
jgi:hypothetical protein